MVVANKSSKYVWAYQAVAGTSIITAVNSVTYEFGEYNEECGKWNSPFVENNAEPSWVYASRTPTLTDLDSKYPTFTHAFLPTTAQFLAWMLKSPTNTTPTVTIGTLNTGLTYPLTIRNEKLGGTNPNNAQAVDCYTVGLTCKAEQGTKFIVSPEFAWGKLEDIGDNPNLTTAPVAPGDLLTGPYDGNPLVMWDIGGDNVQLTGVWRADWKNQQEHDIVSSDEGTTQSVYPGKMKPVQIILSAVFLINDGWDDYVDRKAATNMTVKVTKFDGTSYILFTFTNCRIVSIKETGDRNKGHYGSVMTLVAEKVEGLTDWFTEGGTTFATHWKAGVA